MKNSRGIDSRFWSRAFWTGWVLACIAALGVACVVIWAIVELIIWVTAK